MPNRARAEARAGPVGYGLVEGYAGDGDVRSLKLAGELAAHEGMGAGIGCLYLGAAKAFTEKRRIARQAPGSGRPAGGQPARSSP